MIGGHYVVNGNRHDGLRLSYDISLLNPLVALPFRRLCKLSHNYHTDLQSDAYSMYLYKHASL